VIAPRPSWIIAAVDIVGMIGVGLISPTLGPDGTLIFTFGIGSFALVGALLASRVPANPIGRLLLLSGTLLAAAMVSGAIADVAAETAPTSPAVVVARIAQPGLFVSPFFLGLIVVPLLFPDGRLPSPAFRWAVAITIAAILAWVLGSALRPLVDGSLVDVVADAAPLEALLGAIDTFFLVAATISFASAVIAISLRFRRGGAVERQQIKWLLAVVAVGAAIVPLSFIVPAGSIPELTSLVTDLTVLTGFALPIVIAIAILRYHLFKIDRIISRTISWALVSAALVATFAAGVLILQAALAEITQGQTLAIAASTLIAFALFQPARHRIQAAVDSRFDRARYDAQRMADGFAENLRNEVDLPTLRLTLVGATDQAVRPVTSGVWLRSRAG
jgi:hypothetical protein